MHLSFKSVCNTEHKGVICNMTSSIILPIALVLQDDCFGNNYSSFLDFTPNYERTSGIFVPCCILFIGPSICSHRFIRLCNIYCIGPIKLGAFVDSQADLDLN